MNGFLGFGGTRDADINLLFQLAIAAALTIGMFLARKKLFRAHAATQSTVLLLNLFAILLVMWPSFRLQILRHPDHALRDAYHAFAFFHGILGTLAEILGLYVLLVAGTNMIPEQLRFKNYKLWMRTTLVLWWVVVFLGLGTYYAWYVQPSSAATPPAQAAASSAAAKVTITNFKFDPKEVTVSVGDTVEWVDDTGRHTATADDGSFDSGTLTAGGHFQHKFTKAGTYPYYCMFHGSKGGHDMAGTVIVK
jgi:plastocyanin